MPCDLSSRMRFSTSSGVLRRPRTFPRAFARARPAFTHSRIMPRSNSAIRHTFGTWPGPRACWYQGLLVQVEIAADGLKLGQEGDEVLKAAA